MGIRSQKKEVETLLRNRDRTTLLEWANSTRNPFRVLMSVTYDSDELVRWRAIEATGWVAGKSPSSDLDSVREMVRRLLWQMSDESGGLAWHASELIGEILVNVPVLIPEYADLLLSFLREEPFERGTHFAVYRVVQVNPKPFNDCVTDLVSSLADPDPAIRAFSALTLGVLKKSDCRHIMQPLLEDESQLQPYDFDSGDFVTITVGEAARIAIDLIDSKDGTV